MKTFQQWLKENGMRTCLGPYPPAYGAANYPPEYFTPIAADAITKLTMFHNKLLGEPEKPKKKSGKKSKKGKKSGGKKK